MTRKWRFAAAAVLVQFIIFKYFYPYASYFVDSYGYIYAAMQRDLISYRPIGYSWFLILIHAISSSDTFLVFVQYCLLQGAGLYLYVSVCRLYGPGNQRRYGRSTVVRRILLLFLLFDPVPLYLANTVSSDALFTGLSLVWLTELLWLIRRPSWRRLPLQLFLLLLIFYTRYNALYYPVIAAVAFLLTRKGLAFKLTGTVASVLVLVAGMMVVREINRQQTGVKTFSAFSGWQMANNALYVYPYITVDPAQLPSSECRELDSIVRASPPHQLVEAWYMWDPESPLKRYMVLRRQREHIDYFTAWNRVGPVFSQYGYYLMLHHPLLFAREYGWPSARTFFYPPLDVLQRYNEGHTEVDATAKDWFHYRSTMVRCRCAPDLQEWILSPFQPFWALLNLAFPIAAIFFLVKGRSRRRTDIGQHPDLIQPINIGRHTDLVQHPAGKQHPLQHPDDRDLRNGILLTGVYWGVNAAFSIFATPNVFRYQVGPMIWLFVLTLLIVDALSHRWTPGSAAQKE